MIDPRAALDEAVKLLQKAKELDADNESDVWGGVSGKDVVAFKRQLSDFLSRQPPDSASEADIDAKRMAAIDYLNAGGKL